MQFAEVELPSERNFGCFFSVLFLIAACYFWYVDTEWLAYLFMMLSALFAGIALFKPNALRPLNELWMRFGLFLGMIVNPIVLGLIFFAMFTPIAILMRLFGRDELRLRIKKKESHWIKRDTLTQPESFKNQF